MYELPKAVMIGGVEYAIRSDYRAVLDIIAVLNNPDLQVGVLGDEHAYCAMMIFYPDFDKIANHAEAFEKMLWFVDCGDDCPGCERKAKVYDFELDESMIAPAVGKVLGCRIREIEYLHWWDFVDAFCQIGDGLFSQVVGIRERRARGKMTKEDREYYAKNKKLIDRVRPSIAPPKEVKTLTPEEGEEFLKAWRKKGGEKNGK